MQPTSEEIEKEIHQCVIVLENLEETLARGGYANPLLINHIKDMIKELQEAKYNLRK